MVTMKLSNVQKYFIISFTKSCFFFFMNSQTSIQLTLFYLFKKKEKKRNKGISFLLCLLTTIYDGLPVSQDLTDYKSLFFLIITII